MAPVVPELPVLARDQAFEALYRRYVRDVYHYALAMLRNPADAEDVTQTTFLNAYRAYKRGDEIRKPQNWLIKIAHNVARTRYARASRRVKEVPLEDHVDQLAVPEEDRPNVEGVLRALGRLPFNQRSAFVMRELEGRTYAEIADALGVSVSAVETLIFRARRSLRLRSSAIRVLTAVPLPGSLAQLLPTGAVVAGGGAIAGGGVVVKAVMLLVAGAVATSLGGDKADRATAAADTAAPVTAASAQGDGTSLGAQGLATRAKADEPATRSAARRAEVRRAGGATSAGDVLPVKKASAGTSPVAAPASSSAAPAPKTTDVLETVASVVSSTEQTASLPAVTVPIEVPSVPPLPVEPPPVPPLPRLP